MKKKVSEGIRLGGRLSEVVGPVVEEAIEPGDATPLTGPVREVSIPRAPPPPPRITTPSPPRPPPPPPPPQQTQAKVQIQSQPQHQQLHQLQVHLHPNPTETHQTVISQTTTGLTLTKSHSSVQINHQPQLLHQNSEPTSNIVTMGTVLSFSPKERRNSSVYPPIGSQHPNDFTLNNFNYEQLNNAKNRENKNVAAVAPAPANTNNNPQTNNNSLQNNNINLNNDSARIISEKNALEKNLKKHSLFINALSWKRFSTTNNNKKKLDNNKNKNITFRQPLDNIPIVDKNKNIQTPQVGSVTISVTN